MPSVGGKPPPIVLPDQNGNIQTVSFVGGWTLIYFYPKDDTPGCTQEACAIRDDFELFRTLGITVYGVSTDSVKSHQKFAEKYELPFTLLADAKKEVVERYGVWGEKKFMGRTYNGTRRTSFLINPKGIIEKVYEAVKPREHAEEVLADVKKLVQ